MLSAATPELVNAHNNSFSLNLETPLPLIAPTDVRSSSPPCAFSLHFVLILDFDRDISVLHNENQVPKLAKYSFLGITTTPKALWASPLLRTHKHTAEREALQYGLLESRVQLLPSRMRRGGKHRNEMGDG